MFKSLSSIWDDLTGDAPDSAVDDITDCGSGGDDEICKQLYRIDTDTCNAITRRRGSRAGVICHQSAAQRWSECLRHGPSGVRTPLATWNN
jgi:hypothetical protein